MREKNGCAFSVPGRGDCEHAVGIPGFSISDQHDGPDDTVDVYGKPNGWCWFCWKSHRIAELEAMNLAHKASVTTLRQEVIAVKKEGADRAEALEAIVSTMHKTKDGVPIAINGRVWFNLAGVPTEAEVIPIFETEYNGAVSCDYDGCHPCYSTKSVAEAAL